MADDDRQGDRHVPIEDRDPLSLETALSLIGEPTRARIVYELGEARSVDPSSPDTLAFSTLMERVGATDSGRFNYHLDKLVGPFVAREGEGYRLRLPGQLLYRAMVAGTFTDRQGVDPFPVGACPLCDGTLSAAYHPDHLLTVECPDCETLFDTVHLPARGLDDREGPQLLTAAYQRRYARVATMRRGVCPDCAATVDRSLRRDASVDYASEPAEELAGLDVYATLSCRACDLQYVGNPAVVAVTAPPVAAFLADHDRDPAAERWWDDPLATAMTAFEVDADPLSVTVPFRVADDRCRVVLDDSLRVSM